MVKHTIKSAQAFSRRRLALYVGGFVAVGAAVVAVIFAAGPYVQLESETGTISGNASVVSDAGASGGQALLLDAPSSGSCPVPKRTITTSDVSGNLNSGYPSGTQVYVPGGPDPWGGCFPSAANTGIPAGTSLTNYTGPCTITAANTVIDSKNITCDITITATGVTIKNSKITAYQLEVRQTGSLTITDSELIFASDVTTEGLFGYNYTATRLNMRGGRRQVYCEDTCTLQDSYLHDQMDDPSGTAHESGVRVEQNTRLIHNTIWCNAPDRPPDGGCSADQTGYADFAPIHDNTMDKNFYMAAAASAYCSYGGATSSKAYSGSPLNATNIHFTNNVFQRGTTPSFRTDIPLSDKRRYICGNYGSTTDFSSAKTGFQFTGNMWDDGFLFANDTTYTDWPFYN